MTFVRTLDASTSSRRRRRELLDETRDAMMRDEKGAFAGFCGDDSRFDSRFAFHVSRTAFVSEIRAETRAEVDASVAPEKTSEAQTASGLRVRPVAKRFMSASNSSRPTAPASGVRALASGSSPSRTPWTTVRRLEPGVGASKQCHPEAPPRASRARPREVTRGSRAVLLFWRRNERGPPLRRRRGRPGARASRPRGARGSAPPPADSASRRSSSNAETTGSIWTAPPWRARRTSRARTRRRRRRARSRVRGGTEEDAIPPNDPGIVRARVEPSIRSSGAARARTRRPSSRPWSRGRASRRGTKTTSATLSRHGRSPSAGAPLARGPPPGRRRRGVAGLRAP